jgi:hypothetical protein
MCRFIETTHTYEQCKLLDDHPDGTPNPLAGFFGRLTNPLGNAPGANATPIPNQQEIHVVKEKQIIQCSRARRDPNQQNRPLNERRCSTPMPLNTADGVPAAIGETEHTGICTVCRAAEDAIRSALTREVIVSVQMLLV